MNSGHSLNDVQIPSSNCWLIPAGLLRPLGFRRSFHWGFSVSQTWRSAAEQKGTPFSGGPGQRDPSSALSGDTCAAIYKGSETISYLAGAANKSKKKKTTKKSLNPNQLCQGRNETFQRAAPQSTFVGGLECTLGAEGLHNV